MTCKSMLVISMAFILFSCKKEIRQHNPDPEGNARYPQTASEKEAVALNKEMADMLLQVYKDPKAFYEVNAAIFSEYYKDERVLLRDLLFPESSPLYQTEKFKLRKSATGVFKTRFYEVLEKGNFPILKKKLRWDPASSQRSGTEILSTVEPASFEIFGNSNGVSIYFPYSENFGVQLTPEYFDNINTSMNGYLATICPATVEDDAAWGVQAVYTPNLPEGFAIPYTDVIVDDDFAENNVTHVTGAGAEPNPAGRLAETNQVYMVLLGDVKCTKQYDKLISFTGNGGGSELRFIRGDAYLTLSPLQQVLTPQDVISVDLTRKQIRNGNWKAVNSIWDANWEEDNFEQIFGIYENDTQGTATFSPSTSTTVVMQYAPVTITGVMAVAFNIQVTTQDDIIRQLSWNRESFYLYNQTGLGSCGLRNDWTIYDCGTNVRYTLPTQ